MGIVQSISWLSFCVIKYTSFLLCNFIFTNLSYILFGLQWIGSPQPYLITSQYSKNIPYTLNSILSFLTSTKNSNLFFLNLHMHVHLFTDDPNSASLSIHLEWLMVVIQQAYASERSAIYIHCSLSIFH